MSGDETSAKFIQKIFGYGLPGHNPQEAMFILYGMLARNGKGTLCESVLSAYGEYGCPSRLETLAQKNQTNSSQPIEDVARLAGVRFVNIPEPGKGMILNAAQIKAMTGNDTINARFLHENSFDFKPQFKLYVNTNYLPVINDMTVFFSDRLIVIPFNRRFEGGERDTSLIHRFQNEHTQSAILNWMIEGYRMLQEEGLAIPDSVKSAIEQYRHDSDKTVLFMEDCMEQGAEYEERTSAVYERYKAWCVDNGHYPESMKKLPVEPVTTCEGYPEATESRWRENHNGHRLAVDFGVPAVMIVGQLGAGYIGNSAITTSNRLTVYTCPILPWLWKGGGAYVCMTFSVCWIFR